MAYTRLSAASSPFLQSVTEKYVYYSFFFDEKQDFPLDFLQNWKKYFRGKRASACFASKNTDERTIKRKGEP